MDLNEILHDDGTVYQKDGPHDITRNRNVPSLGSWKTLHSPAKRRRQVPSVAARHHALGMSFVRVKKRLGASVPSGH
jgi:hypothetical protein